MRYLKIPFFFMFFVLTGGCAHFDDALAAVKAGQQQLGGTKAPIERLAREYQKAADERIAACRAQKLETPMERNACLGPYAPDSPFSEAIDDVRNSFDAAATALESLRDALETIQAVKGSQQ